MEFFINNWYIFVAVAAVLCCFGAAILRAFRTPTEEQLQQVREWLLWAVTQAEAELGGGTGQLKLRSVYDLFVQRFPWLAKVITFDTFKNLVDDALYEMRSMLAKNQKIHSLVEGGTE